MGCSAGVRIASGGPAARDLPALLSRVLLAFALDFERESELSLAISANLIRILNEEGVRVRDLPRLSGVSKEASAMAVGFLAKSRYVVVEPDLTVSRTKLVRLTAKGRQDRDAYRHRLGVIEKRWQTRFGSGAIRNLRVSLERLVGDPAQSPLLLGCSRIPGDGARRSPGPRRCRTIPWCCTAVDIRMAVDW
jgi:DNA-binding MarR family transcriptional regulator